MVCVDNQKQSYSYEFLCLLIFWLIVSICLFIQCYPDVLPFKDADDYVRLVSTLEFIEGKGWYNNITHRFNYPLGGDLHWTRLYDCLLVAGSWVFRIFTNSMKDALFWWSTIITTVISCFSLLSFFKISLNFFDKKISIISTFAFILSPYILWQCKPFRPDHHAFLIMFALLALQSTLTFIKYLQNNDKRRYSQAILTGFVYSLCITASPELLLVLILLEVALVIYWCINIHVNQSTLLYHSISFFISTFICFYIFGSYWPSMTYIIEYDKISIVHVTATLFFMIMWSIINIRFISSRIISIKSRFMTICILGLIAIIVLYIMYPGIIYCMSGNIDPEVKVLWLKYVSEMQSPLVRDAYATLQFIFYVSITAIGCYKIIRSNAASYMWYIFCTCSIVFAILGSISLRVMYYFSIFSTPVITWLFFNLKSIKKMSERSSSYMFILATTSVYYLIPLGIHSINEKVNPQDTNLNLSDEDTKKLTEYIDNLSDIPVTVLAKMDLNPIIMYYTKHNTIGASYHRNTYGILATQRLLSNNPSTFDYLKNVIDTSNIKYIVIEKQSELFMPSSISYKLTHGDIPSFLQLIPIVIKNVLIFKVIG